VPYVVHIRLNSRAAPALVAVARTEAEAQKLIEHYLRTDAPYTCRDGDYYPQYEVAYAPWAEEKCRGIN
jgi:hypothetical protein